jgi:hypothetical protein
VLYYRRNSEFRCSDGKKQKTEVLNMDLIKSIQDAIELLQGVIESAEPTEDVPADEEMASEQAMVDPEKKKEPKDEKDEKDMQIEALEAELADLKKEKSNYAEKLGDSEAELKFATLHSAGKVGSGDRTKFMNLVKKAGLEFAVTFYADNEASTPPLSPKKQTETPKKNLSIDKTDAYQKWYSVAERQKPNATKDLLHRYASKMATKTLEIEGGNQ